MESIIRIIDLVRWPITVIGVSWGVASIVGNVVMRPKPTAVQLEADTQALPADGQQARFQAYSHLSRMHSSSSTTFFTGFVAYGAYLIALARLQPPVSNRVTLIVLPLLLLMYQAVKYFVTAIAFKKSAEGITFIGGPNLDEYLFGRNGLYAGNAIGRGWLTATQSHWGWLVLGALAVTFVAYLISAVFQAPG